MYNQIDLSNKATDDKRLFLAFWPDEPEAPEVWTLSQVEEAFGEFPQVMKMVNGLAYNEELYHEESNFVLLRIPSWVDCPKTKYSFR